LRFSLPFVGVLLALPGFLFLLAPSAGLLARLVPPLLVCVSPRGSLLIALGLRLLALLVGTLLVCALLFGSLLLGAPAFVALCASLVLCACLLGTLLVGLLAGCTLALLLRISLLACRALLLFELA
jgi:hypothetical protein